MECFTVVREVSDAGGDDACGFAAELEIVRRSLAAGESSLPR